MNDVAIFTMQVVVSFCIIALSVGMIATGKGDTAIYLPVLTGVTATWLPNPKAPSGAAIAAALGGTPAPPVVTRV